ncbi:MAG: nucleoside deaminase [Bdellovibrionaceae bacterium]|nr:nucleoside deaminase [Pseudobdellovibrionaceae bacterium]
MSETPARRAHNPKAPSKQHKSALEWMKLALKEAHKAQTLGEVPVGALIVKDNKLVSKGFNLRESKNNPILHAELIAIQKAARKLKSWRLIDCDLYITLEPCLMCSGAIIQARIRHVYIATEDPKAGACCSLYQVFNDKRFNHQPTWETGLLKEESSLLLKTFFKNLRTKKKTRSHGPLK